MLLNKEVAPDVSEASARSTPLCLLLQRNARTPAGVRSPGAPFTTVGLPMVMSSASDGGLPPLRNHSTILDWPPEAATQRAKIGCGSISVEKR
jgi:hypothetical protein